MSFFGLARGARTPAGSPFRGVSSSPNAIDLRGRWVGGRRRMVSSSRKRRLPASDAATQTTNSSRSRSSSGMWRGFRRHRTLLGSSAALALTGAAIVWLRETHILPKEFYDRNDMGVDWDEVYHLGKLSNMTSSPREEVEGWLYLHGYRGKVTQRELQLHKVKYFIFKGSDREGKPLQLLLVRGTVNFSNLKSCTKALKAWDEQTGCNLHAGFKGVADALVADALPLLDRELPLKLAGHSSGGGVCIIVGMKLATLDYKVARVMTFGSPKVTDQMGAKRWGGAHDSRDGVSSTEAGEELDSCGGAAGDRGDASNASAGLQLPVIRVTHENDVIPLLPSAASTTSKAPAVEGTSGPTIEPSLPRPRGGRFSHFGHQVVLLNGKVCMECRREQHEEQRRSGGEGEATGNTTCDHPKAEANTYYHPHGKGEHSHFDMWLMRFSLRNFKHRMHHYEHEIEKRAVGLLGRGIMQRESEQSEAKPAPAGAGGAGEEVEEQD